MHATGSPSAEPPKRLPFPAPTPHPLRSLNRSSTIIEQQAEVLEGSDAAPTPVLNPRTQETFILLRADAYQRLKDDAYDVNPWTREELQALVWERIKHQDWNEYDDLPEKP
jgi:hypothetical protein